jgi:hypothetical protein
MPTIFTRELAREWMFTPNLTRGDVQQIGSHQYDSLKMECYTVGRPLKTNPSPMQEVQYKEVPPLGDSDFLITPQTELF